MATLFALEVRARLRALLDRHGMKPGSTEIAERLGKPRAWLSEKLREPPRYPMSLEDIDLVLEALGEPADVVFRAPRKRTTEATP